MGVESVKAAFGGNTFVLPYNSEENIYEGDLIAPSISSYNQPNKYYGISIVATDSNGNNATMDSGDEKYGDQLKIVVKEVTSPTITLIYPTDGAIIPNSSFTAKWEVTDNDSGVKADSISLTVDGETVSVTKTVSSGKYSCSGNVIVTSDGKHTIQYKATDNDGNTQTKSITITVDTALPGLSISTPVNGYETNKSSVIVSGYTNDYSRNPVTLLVNGKQVAVERNGCFETMVTLVKGKNTITVSATDSAGRKTEITRNVLYDTTPPVIKSVKCDPNPVRVGRNITITAEVTDD